MYDILNKFEDLEKEAKKVSSSIQGEDNITSYVNEDDSISLLMMPVTVCGLVRDIPHNELSVMYKYEDTIGAHSGGYSFNKFVQHDQLKEEYVNRNPILETKIDFEDF